MIFITSQTKINFKAKTIYIVVPSLKTKGPTKQMLYLISSLAKNNEQFLVISITNIIAKYTLDYCSDHNLIVKKLGLISTVKSMIRHHQYIRNSTILSQGLVADLFSCIFFPRSFKVSFARNVPWVDYLMKFPFPVGHIFSLLQKRLFERMNVVISVSSFIQEQLSSKAIKSVCIRNGIPFPPQINVEHKNLDNLIYISTNSFIERKNLQVLCDAFHASANIQSISLQMLGSGPLFNTISEKFKHAQNINFLGHRDDIGPYLRGANYFISTSYSEGMPNSVLEALSFGLYCIISDIPPHREIKRLLPDYVLIYGPPGDIQSLISCIKKIRNYPPVYNPSDIINESRMLFSSQSTYSQIVKTLCNAKPASEEN